jgi:acetyl-CoA acyltransferase
MPGSTGAVDDVIFGCANQAGEDNRNVARMSALLAGPAGRRAGHHDEPPLRLGHGRRHHRGARHQGRRGGARHRRRRRIMSRAPFVMPKADSAFSRHAEIHDTTIGWRFVNPLMKKQYGVDSMPETARMWPIEFGVSREDQDAFAVRSRPRRWPPRPMAGWRRDRPGQHPAAQGRSRCRRQDEHPRAGTTVERSPSSSRSTGWKAHGHRRQCLGRQ